MPFAACCQARLAETEFFGGNTVPGSNRLMLQADFVVFMQFSQNLHARLSPLKLINYICNSHQDNGWYVPQGYAFLAGGRNNTPLLPA